MSLSNLQSKDVQASVGFDEYVSGQASGLTWAAVSGGGGAYSASISNVSNSLTLNSVVIATLSVNLGNVADAVNAPLLSCWANTAQGGTINFIAKALPSNTTTYTINYVVIKF